MLILVELSFLRVADFEAVIFVSEHFNTRHTSFRDLNKD